MTSVFNQQKEVARTKHGLAIAGTRITLYQFMDYIHAGYQRQRIREDFPQITDEQFDAAMSYIEANYAEVEAEYQIIVKEDKEVRQYWEERNSERFAQIATMPPKPGKEAIRVKLAAWKSQIESRASK
ncbi:MAG: DUF433 domain-containing protein [Symploca sp. SIO3E6]|nr:DUF433 domain-containing protein [Caldora sp. SIO3E6]